MPANIHFFLMIQSTAKQALPSRSQGTSKPNTATGQKCSGLTCGARYAGSVRRTRPMLSQRSKAEMILRLYLFMNDDRKWLKLLKSTPKLPYPLRLTHSLTGQKARIDSAC